MSESDAFGGLHEKRLAREQNRKNLRHYEHELNGPVRAALKRLAKELWGDERALTSLPIHTHTHDRLRHHSEADTVVWWTEHDIPPYDRFRCEAYYVRLTLDDQGAPQLSIETGAACHILHPDSFDRLENILADAGREPPVIVPREMGPVHD